MKTHNLSNDRIFAKATSNILVALETRHRIIQNITSTLSKYTVFTQSPLLPLKKINFIKNFKRISKNTTPVLTTDIMGETVMDTEHTYLLPKKGTTRSQISKGAVSLVSLTVDF